MLTDDELRRDRAVDAALALLHALFFAHGKVVALINALRTEHLGQNGENIIPHALHTERDDLERQTVAEFVHRQAGQAIRPAGAKFYVDLKRLNASWLRRAGVTCIDVSADCTACQPQRFWSHRRVGNARGSLAAIIRLREEG